MKKEDDSISGRRRYWTQFWCGFMFGGGVGAWIGFGLFHGGWGLVASSILSAVVVAYLCGRWGDRAWGWIIQWLEWFG